MKTKSIKQSVLIKARAHDVFEALMDSKKHSKFTGSKAVISRRVGGKFSAWDGGLHGKNMEVVKDKKIVQEWRCEMDEWPEKHFSTATFVLKPVKGGNTRLEFTQTGVPEPCAASISDGWKTYYWQPMKEMVEN